jgi:hypothetical protein
MVDLAKTIETLNVSSNSDTKIITLNVKTLLLASECRNLKLNLKLSDSKKFIVSGMASQKKIINMKAMGLKMSDIIVTKIVNH